MIDLLSEVKEMVNFAIAGSNATIEKSQKMAEKAENDRIRDSKEMETYKIIADEKTARNAFLEKRVANLEKENKTV